MPSTRRNNRENKDENLSTNIEEEEMNAVLVIKCV